MILRRVTAMFGLAALLTTLSACAGLEDPSSLVEIAPASPDLWPGDSVKFFASVGGTLDEAVEWSVLEEDGGTIDAAGNYTAPGGEGTFTVVASVSSLSTTEETRVRVHRNLKVNVSPSAATVAPGESVALTASVTGPAKTVTWSVTGAPAAGSVTAAGVYTAPQAAGTYTVTATSTADPSKSGVTAITVTDPPLAPSAPLVVAVAVSPQAASVVAGNTVQFTASVTGTSDVRVTWSVTPSGGGTVGSTGLYTAHTSGTYQVAATSVADPFKSAFATVTVTAAATSVAPEAPTGTQFYVATTGDDSNPGTLSQPWRTIQKAMNSATPGSTVNIRGGTYRERLVLNVSGSAGNYITFQPYGFSGAPSCGGYTGLACGGEQVLLDYAYLGTNTSTTPLFHITGKSYIRVQGLTFQNLTCTGPMQQLLRIDGASSFVEFRHNRFLNNRNIYPYFDWTSALLHIRVWSPSNNITFYGNEIGNIRSNASEALTFTGPGATAIRIERNWIRDTDGIAIDLLNGANNYVVRANKLEYIGKLRDGTWSYGRQHPAIYNDGGSRGIIEGNIVLDSGYAFQALSEPGLPTTYDVTFRNNVAVRCHTGILLGTWYSSTDGSTVRDIKVFNNTFYGNAVGVLVRPMVSSTVVWRNNIFASNGTNYANPLGWNPGTAAHNLYSGGNVGPGWSNVTADPQFTSVGALDFRLRSTSPAVNAGDPDATTTQVGTVDRAGDPRIRGGRVDIGAHELQ
jgi:hypothetical protein